MRKLLITLDDDIDLWLRKEVNQNEVVRKALRAYHLDITTDMVGIKKSYENILKIIQERFEVYDQAMANVQKLISMLETRM